MTVVTFFVILDASGAGPVCFVPDRPIDERNRATSQNQGTGTAYAVLRNRGRGRERRRPPVEMLGARLSSGSARWRGYARRMSDAPLSRVSVRFVAEDGHVTTLVVGDAIEWHLRFQA